MSGRESVEVVGGKRCEATLDAASRRLGKLDAPAAKASAVIAIDARRRAPRLTGALRAAIAPAAEGSTARVEVPIRYSVPVEGGVPSLGQPPRRFLSEASSATEPIWSEFYSGEVDKVMGTVKGA